MGLAHRILSGRVRSDEEVLVSCAAGLLREAYPGLTISNGDARRVVVAGAARVNGRVVTRPGARLGRGDRVTLSVDSSRLARRRRAPDAAISILYRDAHVVAVDKPAGLPTHATADPARPHLVGQLAGQLAVSPSALAVHQRLDAGTSGVVLFGLTPEANRSLARSFADRTVDKLYLAIVSGRERPDLVPGQAWAVRAPLAASGSGRRGRRMKVAGSGQVAETAFTVRGRQGNRVLIEARPKTGRQHQIRAQLAAERLPILGDARYGGAPADRLHLHAWRLRLAHPVTGDRLTFEAPVPDGWVRRA